MVSSSVRHRSVVVFYVATALYWASMYIYQPILAVHAQNLGASAGMVGAVVGAYGFSQLVLRFPLGVLSDRVGVRKPFIIAGLIASGLGALGLGLAADPFWLVICRGMVGVGAAAWVVFTVLFSSYFDSSSVTRAMARVTFVGGASQMVSTYAGGLIAQSWGWNAPFFAAVGLGLLGTTLALFLEEKPLPPRRGTSPRKLLRIATVPLLLAVSLTTALTSWTQWATVNGFSLVYAAQLGADRAQLGMLTTVMQLAYTGMTWGSAYVAERLGIRATAVTGVVIQAAGALMVPSVDSVWLVGLSQVLGGTGRGLTYPLMMSLSIRSVAQSDRATAMGVFQAIYAAGMFAGPATTGFLGDALGLSSIFIVSGLVALCGVGLILWKVPSTK